MTNHTDTIVALATPPGEGAIGIIRLSGPDAVHIANQIFKGKDLSKQASHTLHFGKIVSQDKTIDEVVISLYLAPKSYTGENIVEISCHGSNYILQQVIQLCKLHGARPAKPGEFTLRAFLNGKMDLTQAEAVADLIASQSDMAHKAAMHNLRGGFSQQLSQMRETLIQFSALIELELDFSEEDVEFADRTRFYALINALSGVTDDLIQSFRLGNVINNGVKVAIVGKPNAGKSTLLNALLNEDRAIVSEIAGTTRDTIEETLNINGLLFRLIDTAGIREHSLDVIELHGMERSREAINKADIVIYLFDVAENPADLSASIQQFINELTEKGIQYLLVGNKADTQQPETTAAGNDAATGILYISAKNNQNIDQLREALFEMAVGNTARHEGTVITNTRHHASLLDLRNALTDIKNGMDHQLTGDLLSLEIRHCLFALGELTGEITNEDKLDYIFSKFCIGK